MTEERIGVLGHTCPGLEAFMNAGGGCTPTIEWNGQVTSCDGQNGYIDYCPWCGVFVAEGAASYLCPICQRTSRDSYCVENGRCEWSWKHD